MIRSSQHTLKFANSNKLDALARLECLYKELLEQYIHLITTKQLPLGKFLTTKQLPTLNEIVHSQWKQICYKQASQIVRGELTKLRQRIFKRYKKLYVKCMAKIQKP